uniref:thymidine kinase n=1 Tax=viral metagenome TaxID=1070528 RepID=A0A6C0H3T7_9ZZZZ
MQSHNIYSGITLIYGPMFSGKTTKLIEIYREIQGTHKKCIAINYELDTRYGKNKIISHDGLAIDCYSIKNLDDFIKNNATKELIANADYIFINEAQFFDSLYTSVLYLNETLGKNVVLCGLDLDYKRDKFGTMMELLSKATNVYKMTGKCAKCSGASCYSHRSVNSHFQILIGTAEYIPLCETCYIKENNI